MEKNARKGGRHASRKSRWRVLAVSSIEMIEVQAAGTRWPSRPRVERLYDEEVEKPANFDAGLTVAWARRQRSSCASRYWPMKS